MRDMGMATKEMAISGENIEAEIADMMATMAEDMEATMAKGMEGIRHKSVKRGSKEEPIIGKMLGMRKLE